jgi:Fe-S-cluster-containing hydrogenase component 2
LYRPLISLHQGNWFKLICGASFQHLPAVRSLTLAYALAGVDCIDVAADPVVVSAAKTALQVAHDLYEEARTRGFYVQELPWLMVSLNDGEDPHFRKAEFDATLCPTDCPRPCEKVCPTGAIAFDQQSSLSSDRVGSLPFSGVVDSQCYGCGRCLPICPVNNISARAYVSAPTTVAALVLQQVDAVEIHTQVGRLADFSRLWQAIAPYCDRLKLVAISCPDGEGLVDYLWALSDLISPLPCPVIWQTDGRPMSGDIGDGATRAAVRLGQKVLAAGLPGYVQLAGGTNGHTVAKLKTLGLLNPMSVGDRLMGDRTSKLPDPTFPSYISGVAYGSYARALIAPVLEQLEKVNTYEKLNTSFPKGHDPIRLHDRELELNERSQWVTSSACLELFPDLLWQAVSLASSLVTQLKPVVRSMGEFNPTTFNYSSPEFIQSNWLTQGQGLA